MSGDYPVSAGDLGLGDPIHQDPKLTLAVHAYALESGMAALMSGAQFRAGPNQMTTPDDRDWAHRDTAVLTYHDQIDPESLFVHTVWTGYQDVPTRASRYIGAALAVVAGATLGSQKFHYTGLDGRVLHPRGHGSAFALGCTVYASDSPYAEINSVDALIAPYGSTGARHDQPRLPAVLFPGVSLPPPARAGADAAVLRWRDLPSLSYGLEWRGRAGHSALCRQGDVLWEGS